MAAKVNTRFVLILLLALGAALALLGGVYVLKMRGDATRNFRKGQAAFDQGDYKTALDQFGRALNKDPGNNDYLKGVQSSLVKLVPQTAGEATEFYGKYIGVLGHAALHNPTDGEAHLRVIRELYSDARRLGDQHTWEMLLAAASNMLQRVREDDPLKPMGRVYKAIAVTRLAATQRDEDIQLALEELGAAASRLEKDDLAWATQITGRLSWINKMEVSGKSATSIDSQKQALAEADAKAIEHTPDGPETARSHLVYLMTRRIESAENVSEEQLRTATERCATLVTPQCDPGLAIETASLLELVPDPGPTLACSMLERLLQADPQVLDLRMTLARLRFHTDALDPADVAIHQVLDAKTLPVCFLSQIQFGLRRQAASLLGDVEYRRWEKASAADKPAQLEKVKAARTLLAGLVPDATNDVLLVRADGKIAFAQGQFADAAQKFERMVRESDSRDPEMLAFAAASLQRVGQIGLSYERLSQALALNPGVTQWIVEKASLELQMGRNADAAQTVAAIPESALSDPRTQQVVMAARRAAASGGGATSAPATGDPVQVAINAAQDALDKNEVDNARAALLAPLQDHADSAALLTALAQVEIRAGNRDAAKQYVDRGLKIQPNDTMLNSLSAGLRFTDPIQATQEFQKAMISDEKQRLVANVASMSNLEQQQLQQADQLEREGDAAKAKEARDLAARARTEGERAAAELAKLDPENPAEIEFQFSKAIIGKDWSKAAELVATVKRLDMDHAGGKFYEGRMEGARGNYREAIAALEAATDRLSFSSVAWRALAMAYQGAGNFAQAERAYEQAYRCNPNDINGARAYLNLLSRRGDKTRALQILQSVHVLAPQDVALREMWLGLESEVGDKATALRQRAAIYAREPADRDNAAALAMLLASLEPTRENMLDDNGQPTYSAQRWSAMSPADQDDARRTARERWLLTSDKIINDLAQGLGDDLRVAILRASALHERGDLRGGETVLKDFIARRDKSQQTEDMYIELGRYQARISHYSDAIDSLKAAVALAGPKQRDAQLGLGGLLMQLGRYGDALDPLQAALAKQDDPNTRLQVIECLINTERFDEAEKKLQETTSGTGGSVTTLLAANIARGRGQAALKKGDTEGANKLFGQHRDLLAKAEQQDPTNAIPRVLLADSLLEEYSRTHRASLLDDALVALDRAERIHAGTLEVSGLRVQVLKAKGDTQGAIAELQRSLQIAPENVAARRDMIQMLIESGDVRGATDAVASAIRQNPTIGAWQELRGDMLRGSKGDANEVVAAYTKAYELTPTSSILMKLVGAMLSLSPPDCRGAADRLAARTDDLPNEPGLREAHARVLACLGRRDEAVSALRLAYAQRHDLISKGTMKSSEIGGWIAVLMTVYPPDQSADAEKLLNELAGGKPSVEEIAGLAQVWLRSPSGLSRATELQRQAVTLCPVENNDLRAVLNNDLAQMLFRANDLKGMADAYEVVIRVRPDDYNALNNLAFLKTEELNDPAGALPLAERLLKLVSQQGKTQQAQILDTVGWVYYKNGDLEKAKTHLGESLAILPAADTYVHLAEVMLKSGDSSGAEKQLNEAEKLNPEGQTPQKIKALRDDIRKKPPTG